MRLTVIAAGVGTLIALSTAAEAASLGYRCSNPDVGAQLKALWEYGSESEFYGRLNQAIASGHCAVVGEAKARKPSASATYTPTKTKPKVALSTGASPRGNGHSFTHSKVFRPLR